MDSLCQLILQHYLQVNYYILSSDRVDMKLIAIAARRAQ